MLARIILALAGLTGFLISLYFTLIYYRRIRPDFRLVPQFCRMDDATCMYVIHTPQARIFGLPNSLLGTSYYLLIIHVALFSSLVATELLFQLAIIVSIGVVMLSTYLLFALIFSIKTSCILCFTSHALNYVILLLFIFMLL